MLGRSDPGVTVRHCEHATRRSAQFFSYGGNHGERYFFDAGNFAYVSGQLCGYAAAVDSTALPGCRGTSGGTISEVQFENFYNQFMNGRSAQNSSTISAQTKTAADQLYQQLGTSGNGLTQAQFATALKQMMAQKSQAHHYHHHHGAVTGGSTGSQNASQNGVVTGDASGSQNVSQNGASSGTNSSATDSSTDVLAILLVSVSESVTSQSAQSKNTVVPEVTV
jgi:hypothetical protein